MKRLNLVSGIVLASLVSPAYAFSGSDIDKEFCKTTNNSYIESAASYYKENNSSSDSVSAGGSYGIWSAEGSYSTSNSNSVDSSSSSDIHSKYSSLDCDSYIETLGRVTVAELETNADVAIASIEAAASNYGVDGEVSIAIIQGKSAEEVARIRAKTNNYTKGSGNLSTIVTGVGGLLRDIFSSGSDNKQTEAELAAAKIQADAQIEIARINAQAKVDAALAESNQHDQSTLVISNLSQHKIQVKVEKYSNGVFEQVGSLLLNSNEKGQLNFLPSGDYLITGSSLDNKIQLGSHSLALIGDLSGGLATFNFH
jgi:hypothetical protein